MLRHAVSEALFLLLVLLVSSYASAVDRDHGFHRGGNGNNFGNSHSDRPGRVGIGHEAYAGNGCPSGTMSVVFAPDLLSFAMLFDQFVAQTDSSKGGHRDVMNCDTDIPITIPDGEQMEITRVDFRGFVGLPDHAQAHLHSTFNFRGPGGDRDRIKMNYDWQGAVMDDYLISSDTVGPDGRTAGTETSPCGGQVTLRVSTRLQLVAPQGQQAQVTLDSIDGSSHAIYYVNWRACTRPHGT